MLLQPTRFSNGEFRNNSIWVIAPSANAHASKSISSKSLGSKSSKWSVIPALELMAFFTELCFSKFILLLLGMMLPKQVIALAFLYITHLLQRFLRVFSAKHSSWFAKSGIFFAAIIKWLPAVIVVAIEEFRIMSSVNSLEKASFSKV